MSSSFDELSWLSSDDIEALQAAIDLEEEPESLEPPWQNTWTPINQAKRSPATPPPPPLQHETKLDELPSRTSSYLRDAVLASADRMYETRTARKRKSLITSPPSARKRKAVNVSQDIATNNSELHDENLPSKRPRTGRNPKLSQPQIDDSLIPIRSNKLNLTSTSEKRSAAQAFPQASDSRPTKKSFTVRSRPESVGQLDTDALLKGDTKPLGNINDGTNPQHHSDVENTMQYSHKVIEDLFDDDDIYIEAFLEAERTLLADTPFSVDKPLARRNSSELSPEKTTSVLSAKPLLPTTSPMKPFLRPFVPLPSTNDTSPTGSRLSPLHRSLICFRIGEALKYISWSFSSAKSAVMALNLEIYAILLASVNDGEVTKITLADIFFPQTPPYLEPTARQATMAGVLRQKEKSSASIVLGRLEGEVVRCVLKVTPAPPERALSPCLSGSLPSKPTMNLLAGKCRATILKLEKSSWDEIKRVKDILDKKSSSQGTDAGKATEGTR